MEDVTIKLDNRERLYLLKLINNQVKAEDTKYKPGSSIISLARLHDLRMKFSAD